MVRITGSKCHILYRFTPQEAAGWEHNIWKLLTKNFAGNESTRLGKACEKPALEEYALSTERDPGRMGQSAFGLSLEFVLPRENRATAD
ncbi:hypothetical protein HPB52_012230 [Rhipicephalus sanguineus]|uniref:Uncharacterized protein n=1 Tax=Rhipicephalus sanguineus TaxID=34632 RepID=A0A9D4SQP6_RHISA|nr:hypothetical protein HPB52_012230 [Rhipicephalus sanguineus]